MRQEEFPLDEVFPLVEDFPLVEGFPLVEDLEGWVVLGKYLYFPTWILNLPLN